MIKIMESVLLRETKNEAMEVKEETAEIIEDPSTTAVKMEMDSEEDSEPEFHVSNKNPEKLLEDSDDEDSAPPELIAAELGIRSKTIFQGKRNLCVIYLESFPNRMQRYSTACWKSYS